MKNKKLFAILTLVCFMFTLMPVAAFAADVDAETSSFVAVDGSQSVTLTKAQNGIEFDLAANDKDDKVATTGTVYIWAETASGTVTSALTVVGATQGVPFDNVWAYDVTAGAAVDVQFSRAGVYTVYASTNASAADSDELKDKLVGDEFSTITVRSASENPDKYYAVLDINGTTSVNTVAGDAFVDAANKAVELDVTPNNVFSGKVFVNFYDENDKPLKNETVYIETNSAAIEVNKASDVTNSQGQIDFKVSAEIEGKYEVILTIDGVEWEVVVAVGNTNATYIETVKEPTAPQALYGTMADDDIEFTITDINGNEVKAFDDGMDGIENNAIDYNGYAAGSFVVLTEKPADSDLESDALGLDYNGDNWYLTGVGTYDAEGDYAVKVILDNGAYATAEWTVKKFGTPVRLIIGTATDTVELGGRIGGALKYVDANGVQKNATDADVAATGYAVAMVNNDAVDKQKFNVTAKADEKYVGATITVTAVSEKYDLVATKEFKVASGAVAIQYVGGNAEVDVNNKLEWNIVDENGNKVALGGAAVNNITVDSIKYIVLDKPEGAKVSVSDKTDTSDLYAKGVGMMALTSNKVGNVTVQIVVEAVYTDVNNNNTKQVKYYTGIAVVPVGMDATGDVVVMSIGSDQIVVNDEIKTIPAPAVVKDARTFVPFRALAEAFGAEVAWDAATQSVTAELNGVTIVLTIGSNAYTVNGVERTADVAPYIAGDGYTMVPARAIAEEFGMKVLFTTDANGAVADVLYLM